MILWGYSLLHLSQSCLCYRCGKEHHSAQVGHHLTDDHGVAAFEEITDSHDQSRDSVILCTLGGWTRTPKLPTTNRVLALARAGFLAGSPVDPC